MIGITKDDSKILRFVTACFIYGSIDHDELRKWGLKIIEDEDTFPDYLFDLIDFKGPRFHIYEVIGFVPSGKLTKDAIITLEQLAAYRKNIQPGQESNRAFLCWKDMKTIQLFNAVFSDVICPIPEKI